MVKCWDRRWAQPQLCCRHTCKQHDRRRTDAWAHERRTCRTAGAHTIGIRIHMRCARVSVNMCKALFRSHHAPLELLQGWSAAGMQVGGEESQGACTDCLTLRRESASRYPQASTPPQASHSLSTIFEDGTQLQHLTGANMSSEPLSSLYWPPDVARYSMESVLYSSSGWLRTACIVFALFWCVTDM
jgi:hypothetical protein